VTSAFAAGTYVAMLGCGPATTPTSGANGPGTTTPPSSASATTPNPWRTGPPESGHEEKLIARMLRRVTKARGIDATKPVPGVVLSRADLIARVKEHVAKEVPPESIRNEGLVLQLLGFVPTQFDYEAAEFALLEAQLAGYYEPADGTMYLAGDLKDADAEATLAHELVHSLQDQRWDLKARSKYRPGQSDLSTAVSALAEGDATSAMFDVMFAKQGRTALDIPDEIYTEQIRGSMLTGATATAPNIMRSSLGAPYIYGTIFVHTMRRRGGWREVNRVWDDPPATSEQILHVDKYDAHEKPLAVPTPSATTLGASWTSVDDDVFGELGVRLMFEEWMPAMDAADAASGWGGDHGALFKNGDQSAFALRVRYDDGAPQVDALARDAFAAASVAMQKKLGAAKLSEATFVCRERGDRGPLAMARVGKDLFFAAGPTTVTSGKWTSSGTCALAKRWIGEIAKR
jgi:hypothetical protein